MKQLSLKDIIKQRKETQKKLAAIPKYNKLLKTNAGDNWHPSYTPKPITSKNRKRFNYLINTSNGWMFFKSSYEVAYAMYLDSKRIRWQYEPKTFKFPPMKSSFYSYTPDFYLIKTDEYIEIKGNMSKDVKHKLADFKQLFSKIKLTILVKKDLERICPKQFISALDNCIHKPRSVK